MVEVKGTGTIVSREKFVSSFTRLHISVKADVELEQSTEEKVVIETDENLMDFFEIVNSGRTLYITNENKLRRPAFSQLRIRVYIRQIDTLFIAGHGNISCNNTLIAESPVSIKVFSHGDTELSLQAPAIDINIASHGNTVLRGSCGEINIKNASHGDLDARELKAKHVSIKNASHGDVTLWSDETISIKHAGNGDVYYYGPGRLKDIRHFGNGEVKHKDETKE